MKTIFIYSIYIFRLKLEILSYDVLVKYQLPITDSGKHKTYNKKYQSIFLSVFLQFCHSYFNTSY